MKKVRSVWLTGLAVVLAVGVLLVIGMVGVVAYDCLALGMCP